jgi:hypothetical protein
MAKKIASSAQPPLSVNPVLEIQAKAVAMPSIPARGVLGTARCLLPMLLLTALSGRDIPPDNFTPMADQPQTQSNPDIPYWANDRFDRLRFTNDFTQHFLLSRNPRDLHAFAFFPPAPPTLESEIPVLAPLASGPPADPELSAFVGEVFYPFLGVRLAYGELSKPLRVEILAYRDAKVAQQGAIHALILSLKDADPAESQAQLAALAARQAPRIAELEAESEKILLQLRQIHVLGVPVEYTDLIEKPEWRERAEADTPSDPAEIRLQAEAIRGIAFYEAGFTAAQRHLLFEESTELYDKARGASTETKAGFRVLYFSPQSAKIPIPLDLPPSLAAKIAEYTSAKEALVAEVREALNATKDSIADSRMDALAALGARQQARFAALDAKADDIRQGLAELPNLPGPPTAPSLPPDLTARIYTYRAHKVELLRKLRSMLASPTPTVPAGHAGQGEQSGDPVAGALAWMHDGLSRTEVQSTELRVSVDEFDRLQAELIEGLNKEENSIREQLAAYELATHGRTDRKSINDLLRDFEDARLRQEIWEKYKDYQEAVMMPGLSAGQRRLLFDAAVEHLDLPLPAGEKIN